MKVPPGMWDGDDDDPNRGMSYRPPDDRSIPTRLLDWWDNCTIGQRFCVVIIVMVILGRWIT